jgi:CRP-like cAMP-binding protein
MDPATAMNAKPEMHGILRSFPVFSECSPDDLAALSEYFEEKTLPEGRDVYRAREAGRYFYLIASGAVSLWRRHGREEEQTNLLGPGDAFGEEALTDSPVRDASAHAETETVVLRAAAEPLREHLAQIPGAQEALRTILRGHRLTARVRFPWLTPEETVYLATRKAEAMLAPGLSLPGIIALVSLIAIPVLLHLRWPQWTLLLPVAGVLVALAFGAWQALDWSNDFYLVTNRRVVVIRRVPLIYDDRQETPLDRIQSVSVSRSVFQRMFGFGDVVIRTFTRLMVFDSVPDPHTVARLLDSIRKLKSIPETASNREEIGRMLSERINPQVAHEENEAPATPAPAATPVQPENAGWDAPGRLQTRFESGEMVTYRKHLFFLVRNVFLPVLLLLLGIILAAVMAVGAFPFSRLAGVAIGIGISALGFLWGAYEYLDWSNDLYQVTNEQILAIHRKPLGDEERRAAVLDNILSLEYDRPSLLARLLNFGTVTATVGQVNFTFDEVRDPVHVQEDIFRRMEAKKRRREEKERRQRREEIADWITTYHDMTRESDGGQEGKQP